MKKVLKSYMITYVKSWIETIGTILFLLILSAIVLGMLSNPLQIQNIVKSTQSSANSPDYYMYVNSSKFSDNFVYDYFINYNDNTKDEKGTAVYKDNNNVVLYAPEQLKSNLEKTPFLDLEKIESSEFLSTNNFTPDKSIGFYQSLINDDKIDEVDTINFINLIRSSLNLTFNKLSQSDINNEDKVKSVEDSLLNNESYVLSKEYTDYIFHNLSNEFFYAPLEIYNEIFEQFNSDFDYTYNLEYGYSYGSKIKTSYDVRPTDVKYDFSHVTLESGTLPKNHNDSSNDPVEVLVSTGYMKANNFKIGQLIANGNFKIVGTAISYETIMTGPSYNMLAGTSASNYAYIYTTTENMNYIFNKDIGSGTNKSVNSINLLYRINSKTGKSISDIFIDESSLIDKGVLTDSGETYYKTSQFSTISQLQNIKIQLYINIILGIIVLLLAFVFLNFVIKKEINQSRIQIGIFKAMGYKSSELSWIFALKTLITIAIGIIFGYICSIPLQIYSAQQYNKMIAPAFHSVYFTAGFAFVLFIVIPLLFSFVSYLLTLKDLKESSLELMKNAVGESKKNYVLIFLSFLFFPFGIIKLFNSLRSNYYTKAGKQFGWRMRNSFTKRGLGKFIMVIVLISFSAFMFMSLISASVVINKVVTDDFNEYSPKIDNKSTWDQHSAFVVQKNSDDLNSNKIVFDNTYNSDNSWKPKDLKVVETSEKGYENSLENNFDINNADIISEIIKYSIDTIVNSKGSFDKNSEFNIVNIRAAKALIAILFAPLESDKYKNFVDKINEMSTNDFLEYVLKSISFENFDVKNCLFLQQAQAKEDKNFALYMKDFGKISCMLSMLDVSDFSKNNNIIPDANDINSWTIFTELADSNNSTNYSKNMGSVFSDILSSCSSLDSDENYKPVMVANGLVYDKTTDFLYYELNGTKKSSQNIGDPVIRLVDATDRNLKYGDIRNGFNLSSDALDSYYNLADNVKNKNANSEQNPINAIVSYRYAKGLGLSVGDKTTLYVGTKIKKPIYAKIIAIDSNSTFSSTILLDNKTFINQILSDDEDAKNPATKEKMLNDDTPIFNAVTSTKVAIQGSVNFKKLVESMNSLKTEADTFSLALQNDKMVFPSIMSDFITNIIPKSDGKSKWADGNLDKNVQLLTKTSLFSSSQNKVSAKEELSKSSFMPFKITYALINDVSKTTTQIMVIFVLMTTVLLLIILVVIMSIVVDESARIILTMRAIGYKNRQINWMVMGNYVIWSLIGFIISYVFVLLLWLIVSKVVWSNFNILVDIPYTMEIPGIAFATIAFILIIGWIASIKRINKQKLTQITD